MDAAAFSELTASPFAPDLASIATGTATVVVDIDEPGTGPADLGHLASLPCVVIGVIRSAPAGPDGGLSRAVDVLLSGTGVNAGAGVPGAVQPRGGIEAGLERLEASIGTNPLAATSLALLLRATLGRSVGEALVAESSTYSMLQSGPEFARWRTDHAVSPGRLDDQPPVAVHRDGDVLHVTLQRPSRHNAFDTAMRNALVDALELATTDERVSVLLAGAGPSFCSGGDLAEFGSRPDPATAHAIRLTKSAGRLLHQLRDRVEVRLHGACVGAGIELPAFASRIVATPDAFMALPEVSLGLVPGAGGTVSLPRRIGRQRTAYLALSLDRLDAGTALSWGLIDAIE